MAPSTLTQTPRTPFVAALIHDLKGVLNGSSMLAGLLVEEPELVHDCKEALTQIRRSTRRGALLLEALAAIEGHSPDEPLQTARLDPSIIVREASTALALTDEEERALVIEQMPHFRGNPALVRQLYANLLANAYKFRHSERDLVIRCGYSDELEAWVVADNGIGIPANHVGSIFNGGERLSTRPGSGLGLLIVRWVAEVHGGSVWLSETSREGSVFAFRLPR